MTGKKLLLMDYELNFDSGWGLIRASQTSPKLVLRFEGDTEQDMQTLQKDFINELARICPDIDINLT